MAFTGAKDDQFGEMMLFDTWISLCEYFSMPPIHGDLDTYLIAITAKLIRVLENGFFNMLLWTLCCISLILPNIIS